MGKSEKRPEARAREARRFSGQGGSHLERGNYGFARYTPFYKWMHRAVRGLPVLGGQVYVKISDLADSTDHREKT